MGNHCVKVFLITTCRLYLSTAGRGVSIHNGSPTKMRLLILAMILIVFWCEHIQSNLCQPFGRGPYLRQHSFHHLKRHPTRQLFPASTLGCSESVLCEWHQYGSDLLQHCFEMYIVVQGVRILESWTIFGSQKPGDILLCVCAPQQARCCWGTWFWKSD